MPNIRHPDWDPRATSVLDDQCATYDELRRRCPVAYSEALQWSVFRHEDVIAVLSDPVTFSSETSHRRAVPNGLDPPEHTAYRSAIEQYFTFERMQAFEPTCRSIAGSLLAPLAQDTTMECMGAFALPFAVKCQCAFLGWPAQLEEQLLEWTRKNHAATLAGHEESLAAIADEFSQHVKTLLRARRKSGVEEAGDVTAQLMRTQVNGRLLTDDELTSILRNWTAGEVGTLASAIGLILHYLAVDPEVQQRARNERDTLPSAIDEILRVSGPLVLNKRVAKRIVELGGRSIAEGERVNVMWIAANRDEQVFEHPNEVRGDRDPRANLLYGAGVHVCPGAPLARLELRVAVETILQRFSRIMLSTHSPMTKAVFPTNGFATLPLRLL